jgi:four helix bundle protein
VISPFVEIFFAPARDKSEKNFYKRRNHMTHFRTYQLAKEFYKDCQGLKLQGPLKNQFERAVLSIPLNLAEGTAKPTRKDRRRFYFIAFGSLREVQAILDLHDFKIEYTKADQLGAMIYKLARNTVSAAGP